MRRRRLWAAPGVLAAVALAGCGSSQTVSSSSVPRPAATTTATRTSAAPSASVPACTGSQLKLAYAGTEGATGHLELTLALRNVSAHKCGLRGYPAARLLDAGGHTLPMRASNGGGFFPDTLERPHLVVLDPGSDARYGVSFVTNNEYAGARLCLLATALMSRTPGATRWTRVALGGAGRPRIAPCGGRLVLSPVY